MRIDAHQHFWALERGDYGWLTPELTSIYRDFEPADLMPLLKASAINGTVLVQAAPTVEETDYILALAAEHDFIKGVVGWVDFDDPGAAEAVKAIATQSKLVGLRPMIQDIEQDDWVLGAHLAPVFEAMIACDLVFDALTLPRHLVHLLTVLERHPTLRTVVDHGSKPHIETGEIAQWADDITQIAMQTSASVKLSGLVTEAGAAWSVETLKPYVDHLLEVFGCERVLWGSDWPVCTLASTYERWVQATDILLAGLSSTDRELVLGRNAHQLYKLS